MSLRDCLAAGHKVTLITTVQAEFSYEVDEDGFVNLESEHDKQSETVVSGVFACSCGFRLETKFDPYLDEQIPNRILDADCPTLVEDSP